MSLALQPSPGTRELDRATAPGTAVACPLRARQEIAVGRCVEYQEQNGCHCEHAMPALVRVEELLAEPPQRNGEERALPAIEAERAERLDVVRALKARAREIEQARPATPAEGTPVAEMLCDKCGKKLRRDNTKGRCGRCQTGAKPLNEKRAPAVKPNGGGAADARC